MKFSDWSSLQMFHSLMGKYGKILSYRAKEGIGQYLKGKSVIHRFKLPKEKVTGSKARPGPISWAETRISSHEAEPIDWAELQIKRRAKLTAHL